MGELRLLMEVGVSMACFKANICSSEFWLMDFYFCHCMFIILSSDYYQISEETLYLLNHCLLKRNSVVYWALTTSSKMNTRHLRKKIFKTYRGEKPNNG